MYLTYNHTGILPSLLVGYLPQTMVHNMLKDFPELTVVYDSKGYLNGTRLCESVGKRMQDYCRLSSTKELIDYLCELHGLPKDSIIYTIRNGSVEALGTWIHPDMSTNLLWWCSAKFAVASVLAMSGR